MKADTPDEIYKLLDRLCVELGFCLPPNDREILAETAPTEVTAFVDAVFRAEGLDPSTADRHLWRQVRGVVNEAFEVRSST